jgi:Tfp pilus assembly protein PilF
MNRRQQRPARTQNNPVIKAVSSAVQADFAIAIEHHQAGRLEEAEHLYRQILAIDPRHAGSLNMIGMINLHLGRHDLALDLISKAIAVNPTDAMYHNNRGIVLRRQGRLDEASACYRCALDLSPNYPEAHNNLGNTLMQQGRLNEAVARYRRALDLRPDYPEAHNNLGAALKQQARPDKAEEHLRRALDLRPDYPEAHNNLGAALRQQGRIQEAIICYRRAVHLAPDYAEAHNNLAAALLAQGALTEGWKEYEWRWKTPSMIAGARDFVQPQWHGEAAPGRTLLIHAEQGFGDTVQFCRYAPLAAQRALRVILEAPKPLVRLLRTSPEVEFVVPQGEQLPDFDLHCPMLSLPLALGTTLADIPGVTPYLHPDPSQVEAWRSRLAAMARPGQRIGLVWAGNPRLNLPAHAAEDRRRSMAPDRLAPLFDLPGLEFFSLQKDGSPPPAHLPLHDFMQEMDDFADTAALIAHLHLVISVDTAVAHLAAALGKPVWLLNRFDSDWRWMMGRRDSPWYPTMRLNRQPRPGDWEAVIAEVARDLGESPIDPL